MNKLSFKLTFSEGFAIGLKNAPSIVGCIVLWLLTIWVPYINVGTSIAISLLPLELAKGEVISPLDIFQSKYRRYMGDYFVLWGLMFLPILIATLFLVVPGIVLGLSWSLAFFFLFEKGKNPIESLRASNEATYGSKWTMFAVSFVFVLGYFILNAIFEWLGNAVGSSFLGGLLQLLLFIVYMAVSLALSASYWRQLRDNVA